MKKITILLTILFSLNLNAQINLLSISPVDGSTSVPLTTTITVQFDKELDTLRGFNFFDDYFTNIFSVESVWFSSDLKTVNLGVNLEADKNYYFLVYSTFSQSGEALANPTVAYFTTASELSGHTVTGTVAVNEANNIYLGKTLVALSKTPVEEGEPLIEIGGFANEFGVYSIPNVNTGTYYPLAANDANIDGKLDPSGGDAFAFLDPILIDADYSGLDFILSVPDPLTLITAYENADSLRQLLLSPNAVLKSITAWKPDSLGNVSEWGFYFVHTDTINKITRLNIDQLSHRTESYYDEWEYQNLSKMDALPAVENSVDLSVFMENVEASGGFEFRTQDKPSNLEFSLELVLADHRYSNLSFQNPDTSQHVMWAANYRWYEQVGENDWEIESELVIFGNYLSGDLVVTEVSSNISSLPNEYSLEQNYPNPFNPTTSISYSVPNKEMVTLSIFDILGNRISTLVSGVQNAGKYKVNFDASNYPSGTYFYQLKTNSYTNTRKMLIIK